MTRVGSNYAFLLCQRDDIGFCKFHQRGDDVDGAKHDEFEQILSLTQKFLRLVREDSELVIQQADRHGVSPFSDMRTPSQPIGRADFCREGMHPHSLSLTGR